MSDLIKNEEFEVTYFANGIESKGTECWKFGTFFFLDTELNLIFFPSGENGGYDTRILDYYEDWIKDSDKNYLKSFIKNDLNKIVNIYEKLISNVMEGE